LIAGILNLWISEREGKSSAGRDGTDGHPVPVADAASRDTALLAGEQCPPSTAKHAFNATMALAGPGLLAELLHKSLDGSLHRALQISH
jgi:hypothetical protein